MTDLTGYVGQNISQICANGFHDNSVNHCAHFASHAMGIAVGYTCKEHKGGHEPGASIRVQELFAACPKVGVWPAAGEPPEGEVLAFVTAKANVDLAQKKMLNVTNKHVGVYCGGLIYNYHNAPSEERVGAEKPKAFLTRMKKAYGDPDLGFWYGTLPSSGLHLTGLAASAGRRRTTSATLAASPAVAARLAQTPATADAPAPISFAVYPDPKNAKKWLAKTDGGAAFFIGRDVSYGSRRGLQRLEQPGDPTYAAAGAYETRFGSWAWMMEATGLCESGNSFAALNTYDRAAFTFGFFQMAAHEGADNLVALMRGMIALPAAASYFPELQLVNDRLTKVDLTGSTDLEATSAGHYVNLMAYLNPGDSMETQEAVHGARFIHWALNDPAFQQVQVETAFAKIYRKLTREVDPAKLDLEGQTDLTCCIIFDILHQGRGTYKEIEKAMAGADPREELLYISPDHKSRGDKLKAKLLKLEAAGYLGNKVYKRATKEFV